MKILIGSLLFATAIVINFSELNSLPQPSGAGPSHHNDDLENHQRERRVPKRTYITLFGKQIEIDLKRIENKFEAVDCRVLGLPLNIPSRYSRTDINFMTQADFKRVGRSFIKIVIYIAEDAQKIRRLLGAKLPPTGDEDCFPDDPHGLDPDNTKWFITYEGVDYQVEVEFVSQNVVDINLRGRTNQRPSHERIIANWRLYSHIHFGGVHFLVFKGRYGRIVGAALDPFWMHRPGEEFAGINPHDNPQTHPQIIHPREQNPEPQQNLDQQHHLGQHQNLNPYQNVYQNPYHHQTFDPNQHYAQQGGFQPPQFDLNQSWYNQPHPPPSP